MRRILPALFVLISFASAGQVAKISGVFDNAPLLELVEHIEKETNFRFYFIPSWIDTVFVTVGTDPVTVPEVLTEALSGTGINFLIYDDRIILSPGVKLTETIDLSSFHPSEFSSQARPTRFLRELPSERSTQNENSVITVGEGGQSSKNEFTLSGYIKHKNSGEPLTGVLVYPEGSNDGTSTDVFGFYSILLRRGEHSLIVELMGMQPVHQKLNVVGDGKLDLMMEESVTQLREVLVESDVNANVANVQMGVSRIDVRSMKNIPKILGENDVLKVATTLPGVKTIGEGASGLNVRGGHADQNLVILNEATIYNTSHFLGFFSVFNPDAIRSFELYKSGIPVQYGGRLSSTFELLMRDGNQKRFSGQGGIGPITSHLTLEVPVVKDKMSVMAGGRSTYSNWVLRTLPKADIRNASADFYDVFTRITYSPNDRNTLYLSLYGSSDRFKLSSDTLFSYRNKLGSFQWRHVFNPNMDAVLSLTSSGYDYNINYESNAVDAFDMGFSVRESNLKYEINQSHRNHSFTYGMQAKLYELSPGFIDKASDSSLVEVRKVDLEKGVESALFIADNFEINRQLSVYLGLRYSAFTVLGPMQLRGYAPHLPKASTSVQDITQYDKNEIIKTFHGPEYRFSARYKIDDHSSVKASYNRTRQYIHMLSNTVSVSPTDTWKLSDPHILPQEADQASVGFYRNLKGDLFELSAEVYYKWLRNLVDYKTGANLLINEHIEQEILQGNGKAYGVELLLRKRSGQLTGWIGYSYSRTLIKLNSAIATERINQGAYFPASYDIPHDVSLVTNYKITRRYSFSFNFAYRTGRPITYPIAAYRFGNTFRIHYSDRNAFRIPDYIRADIGFNIEGNHKIRKLAHSYWSISVYNIFGRRNPYSVYFQVEDENIEAYRLSIFGAPIPAITYHFKF